MSDISENCGTWRAGEAQVGQGARYSWQLVIVDPLRDVVKTNCYLLQNYQKICVDKKALLKHFIKTLEKEITDYGHHKNTCDTSSG